MKKCETATCIEDLADDEGFELFNPKLAVGLREHISGEWEREIELIEQKQTQANEDNPELNGRQLYWLMSKKAEKSSAETKISAKTKLFNLELESWLLESSMFSHRIIVMHNVI